MFYKIVSEDSQSPPTHIVVIRNGRLFTFDLYQSNKLLTPPEILQRLESIVEQSNQNPGVGLGALTALPRDDWAEVKFRFFSLRKIYNNVYRFVIIYVK